MSMILMREVLIRSVLNLRISSTQKMILLYFAIYVNEELICQVSLKEIAEDCSLSKQSVIGNIKTLIGLGYLKKERRVYFNGHASANVYQLCLRGSRIELSTQYIH